MSKKNTDVAGASSTRPAESNASQEPRRAPIKGFLIDNVSASIFARERVVRGESRTFYSVSFTRSYKDASGQYKYTKSFDQDDLGALIGVAQKAGEYLHGLTPSSPDAANGAA